MQFPLFIDLTDKPCLVVGDGSVATRKARQLTAFGARVTVVAPERNRAFAETDVDGQTLVVAATDDAALNARVAALCRARGIPVNVVDDPARCTFFFPAVARKGDLVAAVSSGGACPVAAQILRDRIAADLTDELADAVARLGARRSRIKAEIPDLDARRAWYRKELSKWIG